MAQFEHFGFSIGDLGFNTKVNVIITPYSIGGVELNNNHRIKTFHALPCLEVSNDLEICGETIVFLVFQSSADSSQ